MTCFDIGTHFSAGLGANQSASQSKAKVVKKATKPDAAEIEAVRAEGGLEPLAHKWSEEECKILWTYVEDWQDELYHGKGSLTRPRVIARITSMLSMRHFCSPLVFPRYLLSMNMTIWVFADTRLNLVLERKVVDNKIWQIEHRFQDRENAQHSGASDLYPWPLEDHVSAILGE